MAIYHASFKVIGRSSGRSSTAASAYRAGCQIVDERTGEIHDYTAKTGVDGSMILLPDTAPEWATDRAQLWNAVEKIEKRKDAQLARELMVALPKELDDKQAKALVVDYVNDAFVSKGMAADVCFHDLDSGNPHAHIMLTMRDLSPDGFGKKNRSWNDKKKLGQWREDWATKANEHLKSAGISAEIDHRSLSDQGIDREPYVHLGPAASAMEKRGVKTLAGMKNRIITAKEELKKRPNSMRPKDAINRALDRSRIKNTGHTPLETAVIGKAVKQKRLELFGDRLKTAKQQRNRAMRRSRERDDGYGY